MDSNNIKANEILLGLAKSYSEVHFVNFVDDCFYTIKSDSNVNNLLPRTYSKAVFVHVDMLVYPADQKRALAFLNTDNILSALKGHEVVSEKYRRKVVDHFEWMQTDYISNTIDSEGNILTAIMAVRNINDSVTKQFDTNKLLEHTLRQVREANEAKSEFLSKMSHDIRTPLNGMLGMAAIASVNLDNPEKLSDCLEKIMLSSKHLLSLVNDILDIRSIENHNMALNEKYFNLIDMIENTLLVLQPSLVEKNHSFTFIHDNVTHLDVLGDTLKIQRLILNLVSNSIKYTQNGGSIVLTLEEKSTYNDNIFCYNLIFADNGFGIPKDFINKVFVPFERANSPDIIASEGSGLGMSISKKIVESLNGNIVVDSTINKGTTITATIYLKPGQSTNDAPENTVDNTSLKNISLDLSGKNILVAEDDELNCEITCEVLRRTNANVFLATDGKEVINKYLDSEEGFFDIILMDVRMPIYDGYEATEKIRASHRRDALTVPIIAMTAYAFTEDYHHALRSGMNDHVSKPIVMKTFIHTLNKYLI